MLNNEIILTTYPNSKKYDFAGQSKRKSFSLFYDLPCENSNKGAFNRFSVYKSSNMYFQNNLYSLYYSNTFVVIYLLGIYESYLQQLQQQQIGIMFLKV